jgi:glycosyltransferase involved in cell wall biosynthesis
MTISNILNQKKQNTNLVMNPILTIAIPTYNRATQIQKQIRLLLPQLSDLIELIVYDNHSEIPVCELFDDDELLKFKIVRNKMNVGADANIARCFENCTTKWLWSLADDDYIKINAVEIVLNEIQKKQDALFINFFNDHYSKTQGFNEFIEEFKSENVYISSFTMSSCLYNMSKLHNYLFFYYDNLSSMVGTIILVLKYLERNNDDVCILQTNTPIDQYNTAVGWNYANYIRRNKLFIDAFGGKHNRKFNKTLFLGCHKTNYLLIILNRKESGLDYWQRWQSLVQTIKNQGITNAMLYTPKSLFFTSAYLVFQHKLLNWILSIKHRLFRPTVNQL